MPAPSVFDRHAAGYQADVERSIAFSGMRHDFFIQSKADQLAALARRRFPEPERLSVLDLGCGVGLLARRIAPLFGRVHGTDVSGDSVREAARAGGAVSYSLYDGGRLPFQDGAFDLVLAAGVLHHVPRAARPSLARELLRAASPSGGVAVFEHNPFHPLTRLAVSRCEFDRGAELLSLGETCALLRGTGGRIVERRYILFLPFRGRIARGIEWAIGRVPLGAQYLVFAGARPQR